MKPYIPTSLPLQNIRYEEIVGILGEANRALARYDGRLAGAPNPNILLSPLIAQEAVMSSTIEGTQVTLGEVLEFEAGGDLGADSKTYDAQEIQNYRQAMVRATQSLTDRQISLAFIKEMHGILMGSVRGQDKSPGEFRADQNWIGSPGCTIDEATFVPPNPLQLVGYMEDWERYVQTADRDPLVQAAVIHAQFELIHPFNDGNGRIGRLLIPLYLHSCGVLGSPTLYISGYFEKHRDEYIEKLSRISRDGDWQGWIMFFLAAVVNQAKKNSEQVMKVLALHERMRTQVQDVTHSQYAAKMVDGMFSLPVFNTGTLLPITDIPEQTLGLMIRQLKEARVLITIKAAAGRRAAIHALPELINIIEDKEVFVREATPENE